MGFKKSSKKGTAAGTRIDLRSGSITHSTSRRTASESTPPELARHRQHRKSTLKSGRTIGEQREKLETASERQAAHKKARRKKRTRIVVVTLTFLAAAACLVVLYLLFFKPSDTPILSTTTPTVTYEPTVQIIDESSASAGVANAEISNRMKNYVGQAEVDFRDLGYTVDKVILSSGSIRELDFYLKDQPGYVKLHLDRDTAPSVEDADRLIRYLKQQGITTYEYLDVRLPEKAYWK